MTLIGESLTSHVTTLTPILAKILTSDRYNCWALITEKECRTPDLAQEDLQAGLKGRTGPRGQWRPKRFV